MLCNIGYFRMNLFKKGEGEETKYLISNFFLICTKNIEIQVILLNILWPVAYAHRIFAWTDHCLGRVEPASNVVPTLNVQRPNHHHLHRYQLSFSAAVAAAAVHH